MSLHLRQRLRLLAITGAALAALVVPANALAVERTWDGGAATASWFDNNNWAPDGVPTAADDVTIPQLDPVNPEFDLYVTVPAGMLAADANSLNLRGVLFVEATLTVVGAIAIEGGGLDLEGGPAAVSAASITATGTGIFADGGYVTGTGDVTTTGGTTIGDYGFVQPDSGTVTTLFFGGPLNIQPGGYFQLQMDSATSYGRFQASGTNDGEIVVSPANGYAPAAGDTFQVVIYPGAGPVDLFASVDNRQVGGGRYMTQGQNGNALELTTAQSTIAVSEGGYPGSSVTVTGSGFVANETIGLDVFSDDAYTQASGTASASGAFSIVVPISTSFKAGSITAFASGSISSTSTAATGTLVAVPPCPTGQVGTQPNCTTPTPTPPAPTADPNVATDGPDTLIGSAGDDTFYGGSGADYFSGGAGDDRFYGGTGWDTAFGGNGDDYLNGGLGNDLVSGGRNADRVYGARGNDRAFGGTGNDIVSGGPGNDIVRGGPGNDFVFCGTGTDLAFGEASNDVVGCRDGRGGDLINGGSGRDLCIGDKGDLFVSCERRFAF